MKPKSSSWKISDTLPILFSLIAIVVSAYALVIGQKQHEDLSSADVIDKIYDDYFNLLSNTIEHVETIHLDEDPKNYYRVRNMIRIFTDTLSDKEKMQILLLERASANLIFTSFEHNLKQWLLANEVGDKLRIRAMKEEISYYTDVYLRNPRLLWYWAGNGGGWVHSADPSTIIFYNNNVLNNPDKPLEEQQDPDGVLPGFDPTSSGNKID